MSVYKKIKTEIKTADSLIKALNDLGLHPECSQNLRENSVILKSNWSNLGGRDQNVAIAVQREALEKADLMAMDGIGFAWNGSGYDLICDHMDEESHYGRSHHLVDRVKQRYTLHEAKRIASLQGYSLQEKTLSDGTIQLICTSTSY